MPSKFPEPKNCAQKIPAPDIPPNIQRLKTKISWFAMATPDIGSVPSLPTIILSRRLTKLVMPFWTTIGTAIAISIA